MVADTCRYSGRPLFNSATAIVWNIGINCPLENLQVSDTTLVSLLFIYMIPIDSKIINFLYTCLFTFFEKKLQLVNLHTPLQKKEWLVYNSRISYWNAHKPVCFVLSYVLSITQQYKQRTTWEAFLQSIQLLRRRWKITCETCAPYLDSWKPQHLNFSNVELFS